MSDVTAHTVPQVVALAGRLQGVVTRMFSMLRLCGTSDGPSSSNLSLAQLSILLTLLNQGPLRMTELALHERVRAPTATVAIRRLEKLGLVERSQDQSDLRSVLVTITPRGVAHHTTARAARHAHLLTLLNKLSKDDLDTLRKALGPLERLVDG